MNANSYLNLPMSSPSSSSLVNTGINSSLKSSSMGLFDAFSFGADILQGVFGAIQNERAMKKQAEENQKNRDFAEKMYYQQRNDNISQWQMQNAYNAPDAQVERMKMAGLNPNLLVSGGLNDSTPLNASSASTPSGSVSPMPYNPVDLTSKALQIERQQAEIDLLKSQARKNNAEGSIFESDAKFRDAWNQGQLDCNNMKIVTGYDITDAQVSHLRKSIESLDQQISESKAKISQIVVQNKLYSEQAIGQYIDNQFKSKHWQAIIDNIASQTSLNKQQAYDLAATLANRLLLMSAQADSAVASSSLSYAQASNEYARNKGINVENGILELNLKELKKTSKWRINAIDNSNIGAACTFGLSSVLGGFVKAAL